MTKRSRFFKWLMDNNKLEVYQSMVDIYYNAGSVLDNRCTAQTGILEIEKRYVKSKYNIAGQIKKAKEEDELEEN